MNCPVCSSADHSLLYTSLSHQSARHIFPSHEARHSILKKHISQLWKKESCDMLVCNNCKLVFANPFVAGDSQFYNIVYADRTNYPEWRWEFEKTLSSLAKEAKPISMLLEIGAGSGVFLRKITESLFSKAQVHGIDFSDFGLKELEKNEIKGFGTDIRDDEFLRLGYKYNVVCMFQVLEHLDRLDHFFESLDKITEQGTSLYIGVPNQRMRDLYRRAGIIMDQPPTHITTWNANSMKALGDRKGWTILEHQLEPQKPHITLYKLLVALYLNLGFLRTIESIRPPVLRKTVKALLILGLGIKSIRLFPALLNHRLGSTQWFHLRKMERI